MFDLDGTLADTVELIVQSHQHTIGTKLGKQEDPAVLRTWIGRTLEVAYHDYCPERADELVAAYIEWSDANTARLLRGFDGIGQVVDQLDAAGLRLAVATSKRRSQATRVMSELGLDEHIEVLVTMEDTDKHKPDPQPLLMAVQALGGTPAEAVYVGDAVVDTLAGKAAGMSTVAVTWGAGHPDALAGVRPDRVAHTPQELSSILLGAPRAEDGAAVDRPGPRPA